MKLRKLQTAFKKAQATEKAARAAYEKVVSRAQVVAEAWIEAKATYKAARKELKNLRKETALTQAAHKAAKSCFNKSVILLQKLTRKFKKAEKKSAAKKTQKSPAAARPKKHVKKTGARKPKVPVSLPPSTEFPEASAAQA